MKREIQTFIDAVEADEIQHFTVDTTEKDFEKDPDGAMAPLAAFIREQIGKDRLAQAELKLTDTAVSVRLEMSVINLPLQDSKTIGKILETDDEADINVYAVIETPDINVSGLRIDALAPATTYVDQAAVADESLHDWLKLQIEKLQTAAANQAEMDVKKPAEDTTATKKPAAKKTTRKTTAKKAPAKKPAAKRTTTKKTK
ncbi:hypothetical protein [Levilactobacillus angrenensis]|uniref:Uncharacterized protein n=1 Tax=Levilactobacillus angrenensis TaxID=2486020 RepID=A0ABW1U7I6_9LACO|nr:hypothetical protein [Levilactobacillus angrenensis]